MNLALLDPFKSAKPVEFLEKQIECFEVPASATCCVFNRHGSYFAVGCSNGRFVICDFATHSVVRTFIAHVRAVSTLSWNKKGSEILSGSTDGSIKLWDVVSGTELAKFDVKHPVFSVTHIPRNKDLGLVCCIGQCPMVIHLRDQHMTLLDGQSKDNPIHIEIGHCAAPKPDGKSIYVAGEAGLLHVFDVSTGSLTSSFCIGSASSGVNGHPLPLPESGLPVCTVKCKIKKLQFSRQGEHLLISGTDRTVRLLNVQSNHVTQEFQEPVNKLSWKQCCFSSDGEYILAGSSESGQYHIYIWSTADGQLLKQLDFPRDSLLDFACHPLRAYMLVATKKGVVHIWGSDQQASWAAFAPDFEELQENEEYTGIEKEEEINDRSVSQGVEDDCGIIDVITVQSVYSFSSDSEESDCVVPVKPIEEKIRLSKHKLVKVGPRDNRNDGATSKGIEVFRELTYTAQEKKRKYIAGSPKSSK